MTTLTLSSITGSISVTQARDHLVDMVGSPLRQTTLPTCRLDYGVFHLANL